MRPDDDAFQVSTWAHAERGNRRDAVALGLRSPTHNHARWRLRRHATFRKRPIGEALSEPKNSRMFMSADALARVRGAAVRREKASVDGRSSTGLTADRSRHARDLGCGPEGGRPEPRGGRVRQ